MPLCTAPSFLTQGFSQNLSEARRVRGQLERRCLDERDTSEKRPIASRLLEWRARWPSDLTKRDHRRICREAATTVFAEYERPLLRAGPKRIPLRRPRRALPIAWRSRDLRPCLRRAPMRTRGACRGLGTCDMPQRSRSWRDESTRKARTSAAAAWSRRDCSASPCVFEP